MYRSAYPVLALTLSFCVACSQDDLNAVQIPDCDDQNICTTDRWDQELFECVFEAVDDGTSCPRGAGWHEIDTAEVFTDY